MGAWVDVFSSLSKYLIKGCALIPEKLWLVRQPLQTFIYNSSYIYCCYVWTSLTQIHWTASFPSSFLPYTEAHVRYDLAVFPTASHVWYDLAMSSCTIWSSSSFLYDINLRATHTTLLSTRGVKIPIYLVSSTTDSIRRCVVLFKECTLLDSDPKSEFLCQLSCYCKEPADLPWTTLYTWDISHALIHHVSSLHPES